MFKQHCENINEIEEAIKLIERDLRKYISMAEERPVYKYTKLLSQLIICWAETRILKLAYEKNAFDVNQINEIITRRTLEQKWLTSLNIAISKAYKIKSKINIENSLPFTARARYNEIKKLINTDLVPSIELRNRIAHGQWRIAFTNNLKAISTELTGRLRTENIVSLQLKKKLLIRLAILIHDLAVSPKTFERDFDKNYSSIEQNKINIHKRDYGDYKAKMIYKYQKGLTKRRSTTP